MAGVNDDKPSAPLTDARIAEFGDWRGEIEGAEINEAAFEALEREAGAANGAKR